jgi:D-alanine-D-alanine ligase-like ATP-grasp enzyme
LSPNATFRNYRLRAKLVPESLGLRFLDLNDGNGYVFAVEGKSGRLLSGAGWICSYPINTSSAYGISRDKAHTKSVLRHFGIPIILGSHFFNTLSHSALRNPGHESGDAQAFAARLGFPVFCKPNTGARGDYAELVLGQDALTEYMNRLPQMYDAFLVEQLIRGDEYRVLLHDNKPIYYALKRPPQLTGDGIHTLGELLASINETIRGKGVSPYPESSITATGLAPDYRPRDGMVIPLVGRQNLSALGGIDRLNTDVPDALLQIARSACAAIGLRLGAVDIFDRSSRRDLSDLVVIEVNGNPTLKALEDGGHLDLIIGIWTAMIREKLAL